MVCLKCGVVDHQVGTCPQMRFFRGPRQVMQTLRSPQPLQYQQRAVPPQQQQQGLAVRPIEPALRRSLPPQQQASHGAQAQGAPRFRQGQAYILSIGEAHASREVAISTSLIGFVPAHVLVDSSASHYFTLFVFIIQHTILYITLDSGLNINTR